MKKLLIGLTLLMLITAITIPVNGGNQVNINVNMTPSATINITCNQSAWNPTAKLGENETTSATWARLTNSGSVNVTVNISASNSTNWNINATPDHNKFELRMYINGSWEDLSFTNQTFDSDISPTGANYTDFGLWLFMPTTSSTSNSQTSTITFTATAK